MSTIKRLQHGTSPLILMALYILGRTQLSPEISSSDEQPDCASACLRSGNITALAKDGVILDYHYTHWHCSPSRRSFLTGRLPIHHGEQLSGNVRTPSPDAMTIMPCMRSHPYQGGDDIDLRMAWISDKLGQAGYSARWFGKYHTGFRSMRHLPIAHHFKCACAHIRMHVC